VIPAQENHPARETWNPTFELEYWADALDIAGRWRGAWHGATSSGTTCGRSFRRSR